MQGSLGSRTRQCRSSQFPPRSPSGRSPERDLEPVEQRAPLLEAWTDGLATVFPRALAADVPGERPDGRFGGIPCADPSNSMPPREPVVGRDDVETCAGGRCRRGWSGRPSAAQPGAECRAASSGTPTMHAGPREHKRRWQPAGVRPVVGSALHTRVPAVRRRGKTAGGVPAVRRRGKTVCRACPALYATWTAMGEVRHRRRRGRRWDEVRPVCRACPAYTRTGCPRDHSGARSAASLLPLSRRTWAATGARSCAVDAGVDPVTPAAHDRCARWRNPHPTPHREVDDETRTDGARVDRAPPPRRGRPRRETSRSADALADHRRRTARDFRGRVERPGHDAGARVPRPRAPAEYLRAGVTPDPIEGLREGCAAERPAAR